jgi:hypothetical protein
LFSLILILISSPQVAAQACYWSGTAPVCDGSCAPHESEIDRRATSPGSPPASAQYQTAFNDLGQQGYRVTHISGWQSGGVPHFAAIWKKIIGPDWIAQHGILANTYQEEFDKFSKQGYRLRHVGGYHAYN